MYSTQECVDYHQTTAVVVPWPDLGEKGRRLPLYSLIIVLAHSLLYAHSSRTGTRVSAGSEIRMWSLYRRS